MKKRIAASFGTLDACKKELASAATAHFGSSGARLALDGDKLINRHFAAENLG